MPVFITGFTVVLLSVSTLSSKKSKKTKTNKKQTNKKTNKQKKNKTNKKQTKLVKRFEISDKKMNGACKIKKDILRPKGITLSKSIDHT